MRSFGNELAPGSLTHQSQPQVLHPNAVSSPTRSISNLLEKFSVTSPTSSRWAERRRQTDMTDLINHRAFIMKDCRTTISLPSGNDGAQLLVKCVPATGPYAIIQGEQELSNQGEVSYTFCIECDDSYPFNAPVVTCVSPATLYHPNCVPHSSISLTTSSNTTSSSSSTSSTSFTSQSSNYRVLHAELTEWSPHKRLSDVISWLQTMLLAPSTSLLPSTSSSMPNHLQCNQEIINTLTTNPALFRARIKNCWHESMSSFISKEKTTMEKIQPQLHRSKRDRMHTTESSDPSMSSATTATSSSLLLSPDSRKRARLVSNSEDTTRSPQPKEMNPATMNNSNEEIDSNERRRPSLSSIHKRPTKSVRRTIDMMKRNTTNNNATSNNGNETLQALKLTLRSPINMLHPPFSNATTSKGNFGIHVGNFGIHVNHSGNQNTNAESGSTGSSLKKKRRR